MKNYTVQIEYTKAELHTVKATSVANAIATANGRIFARKTDDKFTNVYTEITRAGIPKDDPQTIISDICIVSENVFGKRSK